MRENGSSQNGGPQRHVDETDEFKQLVKGLEPRVPRIRSVVRAMRAQLRHDAKAYGALEVEDEDGDGNGKWARLSAPGYDAPALWFYYSLTPTTACLEFVVLPPPPRSGDPPLL